MVQTALAALPRGLRRFIQYSLIGSGTFIFDIALLFVLTSVFHVYYLISAAVSFLLAISINYLLSRSLVFKATTRSHVAGYVNFLIIAGVGLLLVLGGMYFLVSVGDINYLVARIFMSIITGLWNYFMNLYFNFKVAGK